MKEVLVENRLIKIKDLRANKGQLVDRGIPTNPRKITKEKYNLLLQSLEKSNLTQIRPLDVIEHEGKFIVLSGNQRLRALKELKIKEVPCNILRDDLEPDTYRQIVLQANTNYGEHDDDLLANEWDAVELHEWGYDLPSWEEEKIEQETQGDDDVPVSAPAITVKGDLYTLGEHRLLCGDSTMIDDVEKLMDGAKADMVFTDPPYGLNLDGQKQSVASNPKHSRKGHNFRGWDSDIPSSDFFEILLGLNIPSVVFGGNYMTEFLPPSKGWIFWGKGQDGQLTASDGELAWTNQDKPLRAITVNRANIGKSVHPTQKPLKVIEFCIDYIESNKSVLDFFLGSGSTLIACEKTNRKCYGMELHEKYCDVIVKRYIEFCVKNNKEAKVYRNGDLISNDVFLVESEGKS